MNNVPGFIKITKVYGFNYLETPVGRVEMNEELFLRRNGVMINLGTFSEADARAGPGKSNIIGIDGTNYGNFGTPTIDDNLFISAKPRNPPPPGQRDIPTLATLARQALPDPVTHWLRTKPLHKDNESGDNESGDNEPDVIGFAFPPPDKITYSDGSNQNAGNFKHRKSRSRKSRSRKSRSRKSRSRKSHSRKSRSRKSRSRRVRHR
jgi:hypothetical protein